MLWEGTCFLALTTNYITVVFTVPNYCCQNRLTDMYIIAANYNKNIVIGVLSI